MMVAYRTEGPHPSITPKYCTPHIQFKVHNIYIHFDASLLLMIKAAGLNLNPYIALSRNKTVKAGVTLWSVKAEACLLESQQQPAVDRLCSQSIYADTAV
jgi:hypothetical protein